MGSFCALLSGAGGIWLALRHASKVDALVRKLPSQIVHLLAPHNPPEAELHATQFLIGSLRAGQSLDFGLEKLSSCPHSPSEATALARRVLHGPTPETTLGRYLSNALRNGTPPIGPLQGFERALSGRRRLYLKGRALTGQCRAQAEVLSWLPWCLGAAILIIDTSWAQSAANRPLSWWLWGLSAGLCGAGRAWIRRALDHCLSPRDQLASWEEIVAPEFTLRLIGELALGKDAETATELALPIDDHAFRAAFRSGFPSHSSLSRLPQLIARAQTQGGPIREDLLSFLKGLQENCEARWEERVQRLPVLILAPLFLCFFPSTLIMLASLLLPALQGVP